jgi:hypothetical protein
VPSIDGESGDDAASFSDRDSIQTSGAIIRLMLRRHSEARQSRRHACLKMGSDGGFRLKKWILPKRSTRSFSSSRWLVR